MDRSVKKYAKKLANAGLADISGSYAPIVGGLDHRIVWSRAAPEIPVLEGVFEKLNINSLVFLRPLPPYGPIIEFLARRAQALGGPILPQDCETRTFLHDLPVTENLAPEPVIAALKHRKSVIVLGSQSGTALQGPAVIAHGTVSPEQGFVTVSSVCFACFVKFFSDYLEDLKTGTAHADQHRLHDALMTRQAQMERELPDLMKGPFTREADVYKAVIQAGKKTVEYGLVDSYFGNVSYCWQDTLYISQTGSSLDELAGCIDPVPLDGSSSTGLTASSELSAHLETIAETGCRAILHGHPRFAVILSMDCDPDEKKECGFSKECHIRCPKKRTAASVPIVPGEVGTGPFGLCRTLPTAFDGSDSAIVYGHGLFTIGKDDFRQAFSSLLRVETQCRALYREKVRKLKNTRQTHSI